jgi:hypothetical protein
MKVVSGLSPANPRHCQAKKKQELSGFWIFTTPRGRSGMFAALKMVWRF